MKKHDIVTDFRHYFDFPVSFDGMYIRDAKGEKIITMLTTNWKFAERVVDKINGSQQSLPGVFDYHKKTQVFTKYGHPIMEMNGHLHLALNHCIPEDIAREILDDMAEYILNQMYKYQ